MASDYERPVSLTETLALLAERRSVTRLLAGGTDVMLELRRSASSLRLIDLSALGDELGTLGEDGERLYIGALATHNAVLAAPSFRRDALPLVQACSEVGTPLLRTQATVAGNVVSARPEGDTTVALMALGAELELRSAFGSRTVALQRFCAIGAAKTLDPAELVHRISVPKLGPQRRGVFLKLSWRPGHAHAIVNVAAVIDFSGGRVRAARIALGGVARTAVRAHAAESSLAGAQFDVAARERAALLAAREIEPASDVRASATYRRAAVSALLERALAQLADGTDGTQAEGVSSTPIRLETSGIARQSVRFDDVLNTTINGSAHAIRGAAHKSLLEVIRDDAGLTGTKEGCGEGECGSCTVWLNGRAVVSCLVPAPQAHGGDVTTIEGLATNGELHPLQRAFIEHAAVQCGFCIPGMIMAAAKLVDERRGCTPQEARAAVAGNICRCTGYRKIVHAIEHAAAHADVRRQEPLAP